MSKYAPKELIAINVTCWRLQVGGLLQHTSALAVEPVGVVVGDQLDG